MYITKVSNKTKLETFIIYIIKIQLSNISHTRLYISLMIKKWILIVFITDFQFYLKNYGYS